jgi:hypothetical protein
MMMTEEERDYLASLPDVITVYRGYPGAEDDPITGWSWTLDRHVALCFAWRWGPHPRLAAGTVRRDRVVAFINSALTEEMEIIVNPADVTVTACHPVTGDAPWPDESLSYDEEDDPYVLGSSS